MEHLRQLEQLERQAELGGGEDRLKRQRDAGKLTARERIELLFDPGTFEEIDKLVTHRCRDFGMDQTLIPGDGVVAGHGRVDGRPVYEKAFGWADKEAGRKMTPDALFRIASQTKAITSTAILMLMEEGRLQLTEPVSKYLPTFAKTTVAVRGANGAVEIVPAKRAITIKDLLTHTAGISYGTNASVASAYEAKGLGPAAGYGWYTADKDEPVCETMDRLGTLPFVAQPGEAWVYGYNTDILGCVVERASGLALDEFVRKRVTEPLGMKDTRFFLVPEQRARLAEIGRAHV